MNAGEARETKSIFLARGISKTFDATKALSDVTFELFPGEVHGLVGENGAGKSTLIKIMTGIHTPDAGHMHLADEDFHPTNSAHAQRRGVAAIYQEPSIFPDLSVAENIFVGHQDRGWIVNWSEMANDASAILSTLDIDLDPLLPASGLTMAGQQAVEIAKAMSLDTKVLIMDEPTAALSAHEVSRLFGQVRRLKEQGVAILFISHRLEELFEIADRISVFRDGRRISTRLAAEVTEESLVREMVGRDPSDFFHRTEHPQGDVAISLESLGRNGVFDDVSFAVRQGEVFGLAGLVGSGRTDVALALFGVAPPDSGVIMLSGKPRTFSSPIGALEAGIAYLSEDRHKLGLSLPLSVRANITLATLKRYTRRFGLLDERHEERDAQALRQQLQIHAPHLSTQVGHLSGGNQQKTMLGKWLNAQPKVLILDEPTRGIDVGAKAEVHRFIDELARAGMAIILISSDLPEVLAMSDRVGVMREGRLVAIFDRSEASSENVMTMAVGAQ
ncbi:MAG: sugar ABC transporter ATP-binding protein [Acidimicrobiia bacterium]